MGRLDVRASSSNTAFAPSGEATPWKLPAQTTSAQLAALLGRGRAGSEDRLYATVGACCNIGILFERAVEAAPGLRCQVPACKIAFQ